MTSDKYPTLSSSLENFLLSPAPPFGGICIHGPKFSGLRLFRSLVEYTPSEFITEEDYNKFTHGYWGDKNAQGKIAYNVCQHEFEKHNWLFLDDTEISFRASTMQGFTFPIKIFGIILVYVWGHHLKYSPGYQEEFRMIVNLAKQDKLPITMIIDTYQALSIPESKEIEEFRKINEVFEYPFEMFDCAETEPINKNVGKFVSMFKKMNAEVNDYKIWSR